MTGPRPGASGAGFEGGGRDLPADRRPPGPTRREAVRGTLRELEAAGVESPRVEAERLVALATGVERASLVGGGRTRLTPEEAGRLARALSRRLAGEPLQHIEGTVEFRQLTLRADRRALIPRPETEQLVERIARWVAGRRPLSRALDVGTGSGAIALALLTEGIVERVVGVDVSAEALAQAAENRTRVGLSADRLELRLADRSVWSAVDARERFDLIVSNPPYVAEREWETLPREVRDHEPSSALAGGADGLGVIREVIGGAMIHLSPGGALFLEIGEEQGASVRALLEGAGEWGEVRVLRDLAGRDRFVRALPSPRD